MGLHCSFCAYFDEQLLDSAAKVVVINGHSTCLEHALQLMEGDWLVSLSQVQPIKGR